jgi:SAM-dependent methyltransferase
VELGTYDLVSAFYMPLTPDTVPVLCDAVAPGGTLLFVHHKDMPHKDILAPADLAEALPSDFTVDKLTTTSRSVTGGAGVEHTADVVLLARRSL